MTTGEPSVPKSAGAGRVTRPAGKKAAGAASKEPQVSASRGGTTAKRVPRAGVSKREADVLDRLNRLSEPVAPVDPLADAVELPSIVEADPTYPPAERPAQPESRGSGRTADADRPNRDELATTSAGTGVDRDQATMAIPAVTQAASAPSALATDSDRPAEVDVRGKITAPPLTEVMVPTPAPLDDLVSTDGYGAPLGDEVFIDESTGMVLPVRPLQRPVTFRRGKPRVRRVTRVVRHVDTWSVFKVAIVFNVILYMVCLVAGVLLWNVAHATGTVDNVEKFFEQFGWESFEFNGGEIYHSAWIAGLFVSVGLTGLAVLLATLFNLLTDLVGGVRVSVLEEEVVARGPARSTVRSRATQQ